MAFVSLSFLELIHSFNIRSEKSLFKFKLFGNLYLIGAFLIGAFLQLIVVLIPKISQIFNTTQLNAVQWMYVVIISLLPIVIIEGQKKINEIKIEKGYIKWDKMFFNRN